MQPRVRKTAVQKFNVTQRPIPYKRPVDMKTDNIIIQQNPSLVLFVAF